MEQISEGDLVQLKTGTGPTMVVARLFDMPTKRGRHAECHYFVQNEHHNVVVPIMALMPAK